MLCEVSALTGHPVTDFALTWLVLTLLGGLSMAVMSGSVFYLYYAKPTFAQWQYKLNPEYPSPQKVRLEIVQMLKSLMAATLCPAAALLLSQERFRSLGLAHAYCGVAPPAGTPVPWGLSAEGYLAAQFAVFWVGSDFFEWAYHQVGHRAAWCWGIHKHHHVFSNPTPFSVISDEWADQIVRTLPLLAWPMLLPTNIDLLFAQFSLLFYAYGVYLHWGYESTLISAHNPIINGAYEHWYHHARSGARNPMYTGFFFKLWDQLVGTVAKGDCVCSRCEVAAGRRTEKEWAKVRVPDYGVLLQASFWAPSKWEEGGAGEAAAAGGEAAAPSAAARRRTPRKAAA